MCVFVCASWIHDHTVVRTFINRANSSHIEGLIHTPMMIYLLYIHVTTRSYQYLKLSLSVHLFVFVSLFPPDPDSVLTPSPVPCPSPLLVHLSPPIMCSFLFPPPLRFHSFLTRRDSPRICSSDSQINPSNEHGCRGAQRFD